MKKEKPKKKFFIDIKKIPMATWADFEASEDDYEENQVDVMLMANIKSVASEPGSKSPSEIISNSTKISKVRKVETLISEPDT